MYFGIDKSGPLSNEDLYAIEERQAMIRRDGYHCFRCGKRLYSARGQRCHIIPRTKPNLEKYGYRILDHRFNIKHGCSDCNSYAMQIVSNIPGGEEALIQKICAELSERELKGRPSIQYIFE